MRAVTAPLDALQHELDPRSFSLQYRATQVHDQRLDVGKHDRGTGRGAKDGSSVLRCLFFMLSMLAESDSNLEWLK